MKIQLLPAVAFVIAGLLCYFLTPPVKRLATRFGAVAIPRERDVHTEPVPRWGGIAMYVAFMITIALVFLWVDYRHLIPVSPHYAKSPWGPRFLQQYGGILIGATLVAIVGILDDKYELSAIWQTLALVAAGAILIVFGDRMNYITNPLSPGSVIFFPTWLADLLTIAWVFLVAKTVDFMDGLDGLAAGISAISGITLALMAAQAQQYEVSILAAALVGVCAGFLRHNFNPATIIMGTIGAQFLGFVLAAIALIGTFKIAAAVSIALPLLVLGVPIFDGMRVVTQRTLARTPAYLPDRTSHLHHILINRGMSTKRAVLTIYGIVLCLCMVAFAIFEMGYFPSVHSAHDRKPAHLLSKSHPQ
jgi:UDP-GlcNAc:undecaprenyl-phosphate GlcNAc-1-phosphate transferase